MTLEEAKQRILELEDENKILKQEKESYTKSIDEKDKRIKDLELYNQKLFLRATSSTSKDDDKKENEKFESKLLGKYVDLLSKEEIELLKQFEEEIE